MELLIGAGSNHERKLAHNGRREWDNLVTLDMNDEHLPDVVWDLNKVPLPFGDDTADSISAYDVLEHVGVQGDWQFFFDQWSDFWRILKPGGHFFGISPCGASPWAWADPGHTRVIAPESLIFLSQPNYGHPPMTDYRFCYQADFDVIYSETYDNLQHGFVLQAVKPSRVAIDFPKL